MGEWRSGFESVGCVFPCAQNNHCSKNGEIVGFGDMDETGYLDRLYVHKDYQGQGIASAICDELERFAAGKTFTTHASITAKLFFQHHGYHVVRKQEVIRHGVALTNFVMENSQEGQNNDEYSWPECGLSE